MKGGTIMETINELESACDGLARHIGDLHGLIAELTCEGDSDCVPCKLKKIAEEWLEQ